jgi:hypothetical protein
MSNDDEKARIESMTIRLERMRSALVEAERLLVAGKPDALDVIRRTLSDDASGALASLDSHTIRLNIGGLHVRISEEHGPGPVPLLIKHAKDGEPNVWATSDGSAVYLTREWAEKADYMRTDAYREENRSRAAAGHIVRATVVEDYDGWVTASGDDDDYAADVAELLEKHRDRLAWAGVTDEDIPSQLPAWAYCCTEDGFDFDIEDAIRCYVDDNHHEDAVDWIKDWEGLDAFWNEWSAKQSGLRSYMIDYSRIVVIDRDRYEKELAAAKAHLEETK